jgi:predicted AlkP superfamily phosphohydrolase/phosphomutase
METEKKTRILVIGIDGADPDYIESAISQGKMQTILRLRQGGSYGKLKSTIPPLSLPAWACFYTGKNPGKIGIYNFVELKPESYELDIVDWKVQDTLWQILSKNKKKVGMVNNYFTYPPEKVNGVMISAIDNIKGDCYYPKELEKEIEEKVGHLDFGIIPPYYAVPVKELTRLTDIMLGSNVNVVKYLLKKENFDFFMTTLDIDRLHHLVHDDEQIINWYDKVDKLVSEIISCVDKDTNIILMSDHGGGKMKAEFYINEFLKEKGFLVLRKKYKNWFQSLVVKLGFNMEFILKFIQKTKLDKILLKVLPHKTWDVAKTTVPRKDVTFKDAQIDWLKTKAYNPFPSSCCIQINLAGREPYGIVKKEDYDKVRNEVINSLKRFCKERNIKLDVYKREEIYKGDYVEKAPDIEFLMDDWKYFPKTSFSGKVFKKARDGHHRCHGFFVASGPNFKKKQLNGAEIIDVMPTIMKIFGIKTRDVDGKVLDILK